MTKFLDGFYMLEYSPKQRLFHFQNEIKKENQFKGWVQLKIMSEYDCVAFCDFMDKKYVNGRSTGVLPELKVVKLELELFNELKNHRRKLANRI